VALKDVAVTDADGLTLVEDPAADGQISLSLLGDGAEKPLLTTMQPAKLATLQSDGAANDADRWDFTFGGSYKGPFRDTPYKPEYALTFSFSLDG
jgi:hypothetical protein